MPLTPYKGLGMSYCKVHFVSKTFCGFPPPLQVYTLLYACIKLPLEWDGRFWEAEVTLVGCHTDLGCTWRDLWGWRGSGTWPGSAGGRCSCARRSQHWEWWERDHSCTEMYPTSPDYVLSLKWGQCLPLFLWSIRATYNSIARLPLIFGSQCVA